MSPTLEPGDHILVTPYGGIFRAEPRAGDVVVFRGAAPGTGYFVKRIVGTPGEIVEIREPALVVDGRPLEEAHAARGRGQQSAGLIHLADGEYFVMGDNRPNSIDSRSWGPLQREQIIGRARVIFWSSATDADRTANATPAFGSVPTQRPVRWSRILSRVR
jgi:signal peptidase I